MCFVNVCIHSILKLILRAKLIGRLCYSLWNRSTSAASASEGREAALPATCNGTFTSEAADGRLLSPCNHNNLVFDDGLNTTSVVLQVLVVLLYPQAN